MADSNPGGPGSGRPASREVGSLLLCLLLALALPLASCSRVWQARFVNPGPEIALDRGAPFLKCHLRDGRLYVLQAWKVDEKQRHITGKGLLYDAHRQSSSQGDWTLSFDDVVLLETNQPQQVVHTGLAVMGFLTAASLGLTAVCLANPKACFGSCPTFYASDGRKPVLQAEGFSDAVAPSLETTDIDSLYTARPGGRELELLMTNEALETHAIKSIRVLAAPRPPGGRVFHAGSRFLAAHAPVPPLACTSTSGSCLAAVSAVDDLEYWSPTDDRDLATREELELVFPAGQGRRGLVVGARNSLLNTFLFYQMLAYAGGQAGDWILWLERGGQRAREAFSSIGQRLGNIEAKVLTRSRGWVPAGAFSEVGPIAREVQLIELPEDLPEGEVHVRLQLTRGHWRVDYLALAGLVGEVQPQAIEPSRVERNGREDLAAAARLKDPGDHLFTYPGDAYTLRFQLPEGDPELFLESRGYYYEWIREQWLPEQDSQKLVEGLLAPDELLRRLAPAYKRVEPDMERIFWQSRYGR